MAGAKMETVLQVLNNGIVTDSGFKYIVSDAKLFEGQRVFTFENIVLIGNEKKGIEAPFIFEGESFTGLLVLNGDGLLIILNSDGEITYQRTLNRKEFIYGKTKFSLCEKLTQDGGICLEISTYDIKTGETKEEKYTFSTNADIQRIYYDSSDNLCFFVVEEKSIKEYKNGNIIDHLDFTDKINEVIQNEKNKIQNMLSIENAFEFQFSHIEDNLQIALQAGKILVYSCIISDKPKFIATLQNENYLIRQINVTEKSVILNYALTFKLEAFAQYETDWYDLKVRLTDPDVVVAKKGEWRSVGELGTFTRENIIKINIDSHEIISQYESLHKLDTIPYMFRRTLTRNPNIAWNWTFYYDDFIFFTVTSNLPSTTNFENEFQTAFKLDDAYRIIQSGKYYGAKKTYIKSNNWQLDAMNLLVTSEYQRIYDGNTYYVAEDDSYIYVFSNILGCITRVDKNTKETKQILEGQPLNQNFKIVSMTKEELENIFT